jgi:colicin import membrane protein
VNRRKIALAQGASLLILAGTITGLALSAPDARAQAVSILAEVKKTPQAARVASESISKAEDALRRAVQMRASGDQSHGGMLEENALEWAKAAELLAKTADREKRLAELQTRTTDTEDKVFRAQALVEQTVARRARAEEALRKLDEKAVAPSTPAAAGKAPAGKTALPKPAPQPGAKP